MSTSVEHTSAVGAPARADERYTVISADGHAGADLYAYRDYLETRYHDDFDAWTRVYENPFADLQGRDVDRNYNNERRLRELEADGVVAEVLFPNTIPPFFPSASLVAPPPPKEEFEHRWAGLRAHNRWLADFCSEAPGRRAGVAQILLNDVDAAVEEIRWVKEVGLTGGIMLPGVPPDCGLPPLFSPDYEPIWATCAELGVPVTHHGGNANPGGHTHGTVAGAVYLIEVGWFSHRALWHVMCAGVFDRHPSIKFILTEQAGASWVPGLLDYLDFYFDRFTSKNSVESIFAGPDVSSLQLTPREYWQRNCYLGASFMRQIESPLRYDIGVDKIMWGADYPHYEATTPYSREALRWTFAGVDPAEMRRMLGENAAEVYDFDLAALKPIGDRIGPTVDEVNVPLDTIPPDSTSLAFTEETSVRPW
jgi:predicted TIM-barrel fold metal-dependent hydrolase